MQAAFARRPGPHDRAAPAPERRLLLRGVGRRGCTDPRGRQPDQRQHRPGRSGGARRWFDGTEVVDGQELVRVVEAEPTSDVVRYVDPDSYRPVRAVGGDEGHDYVTTIEYLPRTPELLAAFTPVIPEGFAEVDPLTRTDNHRPCS